MGFITLLDAVFFYSRLMADFGALFQLMLVAQTFIIIGMCFIVYIMIIGEREKNRLKALGDGTGQKETQGCPHYYGYLSGYPLNQPIPEECFGCANAIDCMNQPRQEVPPEAAGSGQQPQQQ